MKHNKINDNTRVRVRVPRKLYEAIQERMKQEEAKEMEEASQPASGKETREKGYNTSNAYDKVTKSKNNKMKGDKAKNYQPVHSRVYKESEMGEETLNETDVHSLVQQIEQIMTSTPAMIAVFAGLVGAAKKLAGGIKKQGGNVSGITGASHG